MSKIKIENVQPKLCDVCGEKIPLPNPRLYNNAKQYAAAVVTYQNLKRRHPDCKKKVDKKNYEARKRKKASELYTKLVTIDKEKAISLIIKSLKKSSYA